MARVAWLPATAGSDGAQPWHHARVTSPTATRWLRAFRGLAIDLAKWVWEFIRRLFAVIAFPTAGVALLVLIGQGGGMSRGEILATIGVLAPSLIIVGLVIVPRLRGFNARQTAKDAGEAVVEGSKSTLAFFAVMLPLVLVAAGIAFAVEQYRTGDWFLSTPLGPGICVGRLQETLTKLEPERDPQVEKCTRQETDHYPFLGFLCFARILDHGGIYRVAPCLVTCETSGEQAAASYRARGLGVDDICTRSP